MGTITINRPGIPTINDLFHMYDYADFTFSHHSILPQMTINGRFLNDQECQGVSETVWDYSDMRDPQILLPIKKDGTQYRYLFPNHATNPVFIRKKLTNGSSLTWSAQNFKTLLNSHYVPGPERDSLIVVAVGGGGGGGAAGEWNTWWGSAEDAGGQGGSSGAATVCSIKLHFDYIGSKNIGVQAGLPGAGGLTKWGNGSNGGLSCIQIYEREQEEYFRGVFTYGGNGGGGGRENQNTCTQIGVGKSYDIKNSTNYFDYSIILTSSTKNGGYNKTDGPSNSDAKNWSFSSFLSYMKTSNTNTTFLNAWEFGYHSGGTSTGDNNWGRGGGGAASVAGDGGNAPKDGPAVGGIGAGGGGATCRSNTWQYGANGGPGVIILCW